MSPFAIPQVVQRSFFGKIGMLFEEGGFFIMTVILICGFIVLFLMIKSLRNAKQQKAADLSKPTLLINSIGLFALVLGVFGQLLKLIENLDHLEFIDGLDLNQFAGGLKVTLLPTLFGTFVFLASRLFTIILNWVKMNKE